jgi:hypothetical protein
MWITQTYLSSPEPNAPLHVYYLFEDYKESHVLATRRVQKELERLSSIYPNVCILMPNPNSADRIEGELKRNQSIWKRLSPVVPGLVVSRKPIETIDHHSDELFVVPLNYAGFSEQGIGLPENSTRFAEGIQKLRTLVSEDLEWQHRQLGKYETPPPGLLAGIFEAVEIKPGIAGFRLDLKKLFAAIRKP